MKKYIPVFVAVALILGVGCSTGCAQGFSVPSTSPYTVPPYFEVKWDISKKDNLLAQDFVVARYDIYELSINLKTVHIPMSKEELAQSRNFIGDGATQLWTKDTVPQLVHTNTPDEVRQAWDKFHRGEYELRLAYPGTVIPVHFKIEKLNKDKTTDIITDQVVDTEGASAGGFQGVLRHVAWITLHPGNYKITISTNKAIALPPNKEIDLLLNAAPNTTPPKDNE